MITFCIPSKNNLRYLKTCIPSIQSNSYYKNDIIVFVDQDTDGTVEWLESNNIKYILNTESECKGIGYAYDTMFKSSDTDLVVAFHADMILGPNADKYLVDVHKRKSVVCATRIEPPLHPEGPEKIVKDFGMWPEDIKWEEFNTFVTAEAKSNEGRLGKTSFAPWLIDRRDHLGHDPIFLSVFEDADLFRRFVLAGYNMIQSWSSMVYHLTCRGGQFAGAEKMEDFQKKDEKWMHNNEISMIEYIRKWGGLFKENGPCEPRPNKKYDIGLRVTNCYEQILGLEPYFNNLNVDMNTSGYIEKTQPTTSFNLQDKFSQELSNDIVISVDGRKSDINQLYYILQNIEEFVETIPDAGEYEIDGGININVQAIQVKNPDIKI